MSADSAEDVDINDPDFWRKAVGLSEIPLGADDEAAMFEDGGGRKRRQIKVYGGEEFDDENFPENPHETKKERKERLGKEKKEKDVADKKEKEREAKEKKEKEVSEKKEKGRQLKEKKEKEKEERMKLGEKEHGKVVSFSSILAVITSLISILLTLFGLFSSHLCYCIIGYE